MLKRIVYCVQAYRLHGAALVRGDERQFSSETEARRVMDLLRPHVAGAVLFSMEGYAEFGAWGDPVLIAKYGRVPRAEDPDLDVEDQPSVPVRALSTRAA